ncbi:MAG: hypothetical protein JSV49_00675 [Thermoplasmata archaeon]|nr:MAG: hypothetical protein JSV49_00675 [Thermoplasmata archaeon]
MAKKIAVYKHAVEKEPNWLLTEDEKVYAAAIVELLARCWKAAHSFKARKHSTEAQLYLTLVLCEKAGKRRFGTGKIHREFKPERFDDETEWQEDLIEMYNETWAIMNFSDYKERPEDTKVILTLYTFETLGARKYLPQSDKNNDIMK